MFYGGSGQPYLAKVIILFIAARRAGSDGSMSLPPAQQVRGSIPGGVVNFYLKIFQPGLGGVEMYTF